MSDPERVRAAFEELVGLTPEERAARLRELDDDLRPEVASLFAHFDGAGDFLAAPHPLAPAAAEDGRLPFASMGGFRLVREIGRGGMGTVYLAQDERTGESVALKILLLGLTLTGSAKTRFETEARTMERLAHPAIVPVLRWGNESGVHYIATGYVEGATLAQELDPQRRTGLGPDRDDPRGVAAFFAQLARGLAHAHAAQVIHRDVKPANILIDRQGEPHLTDFGLARDLAADGPTRSGDVAGTFAYMSPEQARGARDEIDHRTDVFALGIVLYEVLTGTRPFAGDSAVDVARRIEDVDPAPPRRLNEDVPPDLQVICLKAIEKDKHDRYATMEAMADDLEAFAADRPIGTRAPSLRRRAVRLARRRRRAITIAAAVTAVGWIAIVAGRAVDHPTGVVVHLESTPPGARVLVREMDPTTGEYGAARELGTAPCEARVEPGLARFVYVGRDGALAELSRHVPTADEARTGPPLRVQASLVDSATALAGMVRVAGGSFLAPDTLTKPHDGATLRFETADFAIDAREVTVREYRRFLEATGRAAPPSWGEGLPDSLDQHPAAGMTWNDALAYAEWCGRRLPTRLEFERAARGTEGSDFPWGRDAAPADSLRAWACVGRADRAAAGTRRPTDLERFALGAAPVGSHPRDRSAEGVFDLLGSVAEWIDAPRRWIAGHDSTIVVDEGMQAAISADWSRDPEDASVSTLQYAGRGVPLGLDTGFRCARSLDPFAVIREPDERLPAPR